LISNRVRHTIPPRWCPEIPDNRHRAELQTRWRSWNAAAVVETKMKVYLAPCLKCQEEKTEGNDSV
jgi:hypothetical protein